MCRYVRIGLADNPNALPGIFYYANKVLTANKYGIVEKAELPSAQFTRSQALSEDYHRNEHQQHCLEVLRSRAGISDFEARHR